MLSKRQLKEIRDFAVKTAAAAGRILLDKSQKRRKISLKGRVDLVTDADLASEKFIIRAISRQFPEHSVLAEEGSGTDGGSEFKWIVDPLDGTTNFAHNFPFYCVSIGCEYRGEVMAGAIFDPERGEMFEAVKDGGARLNGRTIRVSNQTGLERSLLATGFPYDIGTSSEDNLKYFRRFIKRARAIRRAGSAALDLAYLACGRFDGFWELKLHPWDSAAGSLMVREAGGKVTMFDGSAYSIYGKYILASNGKIHRQMKDILIGND